MGDRQVPGLRPALLGDNGGRPTLSDRRQHSLHAVLCGLAMAAGLAYGSPLTELARHCDDDATSASCKVFLSSLASVAVPTREQRLALVRGRSWGAQHGDYSEATQAALCSQRRQLAQAHPDYAEALYEASLCAQDSHGRIALLEDALALDPANENALDFLALTVWHTGDDHGIAPERLAGYRMAAYRVASKGSRKVVAARRIYDAAIRSGNVRAAKGIQGRLRRDVLGRLEYGEDQRTESLDTVCHPGVFAMDLETDCIAAVERVASMAPLSDDVLGMVPLIVERLGAKGWTERGGWQSNAADAGLVARLERVVDLQPVAARTSEFHRVYAQFQSLPDRVASLRRAVDLDYRNDRARCALAEALEDIPSHDEAREIHASMSTNDGAGEPCVPGARH